jgi:peptide-methionine (S)-S-oxide reductase
LEKATLGGGCFWCLEAVYQEVDGVKSIVSGYAGGHVPTRHMKRYVRGRPDTPKSWLEFDPAKVTYREILEVFFAIHDPTTRDRQGNDHGPQYRSAIFWHDEAQRDIARDVIASLTAEKAFDDPIVTEVTKLDQFYPAESYHQDYYRRNSAQPYCAFVISPKLAKYRKQFGQVTKRNAERSQSSEL